MTIVEHGCDAWLAGQRVLGEVSCCHAEELWAIVRRAPSMAGSNVLEDNVDLMLESCIGEFIDSVAWGAIEPRRE
jgi:hypothetical protein